MLNVVCVRSGTKYGPEYVEILRDMVCRNLLQGTQGSFHCFTDQPENPEGIFVHPTEGYGGWWDKLGLFKPGVFPAGRRIWFFDLDTVIVGSLDHIMTYDGPFAALREFHAGPIESLNRLPGLQSAAMTWRAGEMDCVWEKWVESGCPRPDAGDQLIIQAVHPEFVVLQDAFPDNFVSYRVHARFHVPEKASVVCFHGDPKPHEIKDGWVPHVWRSGGDNLVQLIHLGNTPETDIERNIKAACKLNKPWVDTPVGPDGEGNAIFVGGGPSIEQQLPYLKHISKSITVFALNGAAHWCRRNDIGVDFQVMADARPDMARMIDRRAAKVFASQCHPSVTKRADILFHAYGDGIEDLIPKGKDGKATAIIGGGSTVGLIALSLAHFMGYRKFHLFGYDSCFFRGKHHAYPQSLNDGQRELTWRFADGTEYTCAPWMAKQLQDYRELAPLLIEHGCEITMYGDGLLQHYNELLCRTVLACTVRAGSVLRRLNGSEAMGVEIGVNAADMSQYMLSENPNLRLFGIDPYRQATADSSYYKSGDPIARNRSQRQHNVHYEKALSVYNSFSDRAELIRLPSVEAAPLFDDASLDFAFIDGDHSYEGARDDIAAWASKVKSGGWLCGHDYHNTEIPFPGVDIAVDEWIEATGHTLELGDNFTWFVRMP